jgi:hypothetical protein
MLQTCETLKNNKEYMKIKEEDFLSPKRWKFKDNFICDQYKSRYIEYPIEVTKIIYDNDRHGLRDSQVGKFAKIAPCGEEHKGKTYLGLYLGDLPINSHVTHSHVTGELNVSFMTNPAIFVFDLNKIVYGMESWWGIIETENDLKEITEDTINNQWYVKALKSMEAPAEKEGEA